MRKRFGILRKQFLEHFVWVTRRFGIHKKGFGRDLWNVEEEFSRDFRESLEEIFGISEEGLRGRFLGYLRVIDPSQLSVSG